MITRDNWNIVFDNFENDLANFIHAYSMFMYKAETKHEQRKAYKRMCCAIIAMNDVLIDLERLYVEEDKNELKKP